MMDFGRVIRISLKLAFKLLTIFLMIIGAYHAAIFSLLKLQEQIGLPSETYVKADQLSPDKQYRAVTYYQAGGGGISPYCVDLIAVTPASVDQDHAWAPVNQVFSADCGVLHDASWLSNDRLLIRFASSAEGGDSLKIEGYGAVGRVKISYGN
jgi:hypothetical protein